MLFWCLYKVYLDTLWTCWHSFKLLVVVDTQVNVECSTQKIFLKMLKIWHHQIFSQYCAKHYIFIDVVFTTSSHIIPVQTWPELHEEAAGNKKREHRSDESEFLFLNRFFKRCSPFSLLLQPFHHHQLASVTHTFHRCVDIDIHTPSPAFHFIWTQYNTVQYSHPSKYYNCQQDFPIIL